MSLLAAFERGEHGLRMALPEGARVLQDLDHAAELRDDVRNVHWRVAVCPGMMDLVTDPDALHADLERDCRALFDAEFAERYRDSPEAQRPLKRSDDVNFSVIIAINAFELPGGDPAVAVVQRVAYEKGHEVAAARMLVPTAQGTAEVSTWAGDADMSWRNSVPPLARMRQGRPVFFAEEQQPLALDPSFRVNCVDRVRNAMSYAMSTLAPLVTHDAPRHLERRVTMPTLGGSFQLPVRFAEAPGESGLASNSAAFSRVGLPEYMRTLEAWMPPAVHIGGLFAAQKRKKLERLAEDTLREMQDVHTRVLQVRLSDAPSAPGEPSLDSYVRTKTHGRLEHHVGRWWVNKTGEVVRLQLSAPMHVPSTDLRQHLSATCTSWESMPGR